MKKFVGSTRVLVALLCAAIIVIAALSTMIAIRSDDTGTDEGAAASDVKQEPPIVDLHGLKQRALIMDTLVAYFDSISQNDPARTYYMSCDFMRASYDQDARKGLKHTVATMSVERGTAHVMIPSSIQVHTEDAATVDTTIAYDKTVSDGQNPGNLVGIAVTLQKEQHNWKVCSVKED